MKGGVEEIHPTTMKPQTVLMIAFLIALNAILFAAGGLGMVLLYISIFLYSVAMVWGIAYLYKDLKE